MGIWFKYKGNEKTQNTSLLNNLHPYRFLEYLTAILRVVPKNLMGN